MANAGTLRVNVVAQTSQFGRKMHGAGTTVQKFGATVRGVTGRVIGLGTALLGVAAAGGMAMMIRKQMDMIDSTAKLSKQLGVATEDLQKLRHAAELTGAGSEMLDKGLATLAKRLGEVAMFGTGMANDALEALGLEAKELIKLSPDEQFRAIGEAMKGIANPTERAAIAAGLFSKRGMGLVNTLVLGREGLKATGDEAERLGKTFSALDARQVEEANDAITRMKAAFSGFGTVVAIEVAQYMEQIADNMTKAFGDQSKVNRAAGEMSEFGKKLAVVADTLHVVKMIVKGIWGILKAMVGVVYYIIEAFARLGSLLPVIGKQMGNLADTMQGLAGGMVDSGRDTCSSIGDDFLDKWPSEVAKSMRDARAMIGDPLASTTIDVEIPAEALQKARKEAAEVIEQVQQGVLSAADAQKQLDRLQGEMNASTQLQTPAIDDSAIQQLEKLKQKAAAIYEQQLSPLEKARKEAAEVAKMVEQGLLDVRAARNELGRIQGEMMEAYQQPEQPQLDLPAAMAKGSAAAYSVIVGSRADSGDRIASINQQQLAEDRKAARSLQEIERNLHPQVDSIPQA